MDSSSIHRPPPMPFIAKLGYSVGHVFNDLCASMWFLYFTVYFQHVLVFPATLSGTLMLIGQVVDGIATPLVGYESDMSPGFRSYGRRKTWHAIGTILVLCSFPFIFNPCFFAPDADRWSQAVYFAPLIAIFQIGWAATQISHLALLPELTHSSSERVLLNAVRYFFTVFSNIFVLLLAYILLRFHPHHDVQSPNLPHHQFASEGVTPADRIAWPVGPLLSPPKVSEDVCPMVNTSVTSLGPHDTVVFSYISFIVVGVGLLFSMLFHFLVKEVNTVYNKKNRSRGKPVRDTGGRDEREGLINEEDPPLIQSYASTNYGDNSTSEQSSLASQSMDNVISVSTPAPESSEEEAMRWSDWLFEPQFYLVNILHMSTRLIVNGSQVFISYYLISSVQNLPKEYIALLPLVLYVSSMITSTIQKQFQDFVGRKKSFLFGLFVILAYSLMVRFMTYPSPPRYQVFIVITLLGIGSASILIGALSMVADLIATNTESGAFVFGAMSFTDKLSNGIMVQIVQIYQSQFTEQCINTFFFRDVQAYLCGSFAIVSMIILLILSPMHLGERWHNRYQRLPVNSPSLTS